jgi:hypothetical protein
MEQWRKKLLTAKSSRLRKLPEQWNTFLLNIQLIDISQEYESFTEEQILTINTTLGGAGPARNEQRVLYQLSRLGFKSILSNWVSFIQPFRSIQ